MTRVLYVCTGNVFRSMSAEYCLKDHLAKRGITNITVDSAGIAPQPQIILPSTLERLSFHGITVSHQPKEVTKGLVENNDLIIAMNTNHQDYIYEMYDVKAPLFNNVAYREATGVLDIEEYKPGVLTSKNETSEVQTYIYSIIDHIHKATPYVAGNLSKWV